MTVPSAGRTPSPSCVVGLRASSAGSAHRYGAPLPRRPRDVRDAVADDSITTLAPAVAARMARAKRPGSAPVPRPPARRSAPADRTRATMTTLAPEVAARMAKDDALLAAAAEAVFCSADLCAVVLLAYSPKSHLRAARLVLTTSTVCRSWRLSVNSARVWAALCHQRWPSTGTLPLPPMVDYCRYFQSRALAQAEIDGWS